MEITDNLYGMCKEYYDTDCAEGYIDEDLVHYIFEAAMEACFGKDVWTRIKIAQKNHSILVKKQEIERLQEEIGGS